MKKNIDEIICHNCGAVIKKKSIREYMDQYGRLCKPCWDEALTELCRDATRSDLTDRCTGS
jgi:hypothetical protein